MSPSQKATPLFFFFSNRQTHFKRLARSVGGSLTTCFNIAWVGAVRQREGRGGRCFWTLPFSLNPHPPPLSPARDMFWSSAAFCTRQGSSGAERGNTTGRAGRDRQGRLRAAADDIPLRVEEPGMTPIPKGLPISLNISILQ